MKLCCFLKKIHADIPHFLKVCLTPLFFYERPILVTVFANGKKSEGDFHFYTKKN